MNPFHTALAELQSATDQLDLSSLARAAEMIANASRIVAYGCGREGLQIAGLVMRLHQLGLRAAMHGDMAAPPVGKGDLFVCSAGTGEMATVSALMRVARDAGAEVLFLTANPKTPSASLASHILTIPARLNGQDRPEAAALTMGAVYEGAMFLMFEIMVLDLREQLGVAPDTMRARQTNME